MILLVIINNAFHNFVLLPKNMISVCLRRVSLITQCRITKEQIIWVRTFGLKTVFLYDENEALRNPPWCLSTYPFGIPFYSWIITLCAVFLWISIKGLCWVALVAATQSYNHLPWDPIFKKDFALSCCPQLWLGAQNSRTAVGISIAYDVTVQHALKRDRVNDSWVNCGWGSSHNRYISLMDRVLQFQELGIPRISRASGTLCRTKDIHQRCTAIWDVADEAFRADLEAQHPGHSASMDFLRLLHRSRPAKGDCSDEVAMNKEQAWIDHICRAQLLFWGERANAWDKKENRKVDWNNQ